MVAYPPNINYNVAKEYLLTLKKKNTLYSLDLHVGGKIRNDF